MNIPKSVISSLGILKYTSTCQVSECVGKIRICYYFDLFDDTKGQSLRHFVHKISGKSPGSDLCKAGIS